MPSTTEHSHAKQEQKCCVGLLYLNSAKGNPTCVGLKRPAPSEHREADPRAPQPHWTGWRYACLGHALHSQGGKAGGGGGGGDGSGAGTLPYCEGFEVVVATQEDTAAAAADEQQQQHHARKQPAQKQQQEQQEQMLKQQQQLKRALQQLRQQQQQQQQQQQHDKPPPPPQQQHANKQQNDNSKQPQHQGSSASGHPLWEAVSGALEAGNEDAARFARRFRAVAQRNAAAMARAVESAYAAAARTLSRD